MIFSRPSGLPARKRSVAVGPGATHWEVLGGCVLLLCLGRWGMFGLRVGKKGKGTMNLH